MTDVCVQLENLGKTFLVKKGTGFKREESQVVAVDGISLSVESGQSVAFIGQNGPASQQQ